jgi:hypothetical protein
MKAYIVNFVRFPNVHMQLVIISLFCIAVSAISAQA